MVVALPLAAVTALAVAYLRSDNDCEATLAAVPRQPMKAVLRCDYGTADVLRLATVETPVPGAEAAGTSGASTGLGHSISSTGKRHNSRCRYYGTGKPCGAGDGIACKICGG